MSQINFVEQFNLFMQYASRNKLTSYERIFYLGLFYCANDLARQTENFEWPDDYFPVSNMELNGWTGFDERAIRNTRNRLKQKGLLDFRKGDGKKKDPAYRIFYLIRTGYRIVPDVPVHSIDSENAGGEKPIGSENAGDSGKQSETDCGFAPDAVGDTVGDGVGDAVCDKGPTDCGFAADTVGEHFINNKRKDINVNTNAKVVVVEGTGTPPDEPGEENIPVVDPELAKVMNFFMDNFNPIPPAMAVAGLKDYTQSLGGDVVVHAMEIASGEGKKTWSYIRGILQRYQREGLTSMAAVLRSEQEFETRKIATSRHKPAVSSQKAGGFGLVNMSAVVPPAVGLIPSAETRGR